MTVQPVTMYRVICDWPDCRRSPQDESEYYAWADTDQAIDEADNSDWWTTADRDHQYCGDHLAVWGSDHEDGEPLPAPPYLLIDEDGHVTLIESAS